MSGGGRQPRGRKVQRPSATAPNPRRHVADAGTSSPIAYPLSKFDYRRTAPPGAHRGRRKAWTAVDRLQTRAPRGRRAPAATLEGKQKQKLAVLGIRAEGDGVVAGAADGKERSADLDEIKTQRRVGPRAGSMVDVHIYPPRWIARGPAEGGYEASSLGGARCDVRGACWGRMRTWLGPDCTAGWFNVTGGH